MHQQKLTARTKITILFKVQGTKQNIQESKDQTSKTYFES